MMNSIPTTSKLQDDEQVELREKSVPDGCGFTTRKSSKLLVGKAPVHQDSDVYNMKHLNRGTCLVFNHATYVIPEAPPRESTYADVKRIQQTFGALAFSVDICHDYKYDDVKKKIEKLSEENHEDNDCVCIIVLTHGNNGNMIYANDKQYSLSVLWKPFTADNCLTLAGKPKLFFISACRGNEIDRGVVLQYSSSHKRSEVDGSAPSSYVIPTEADFLFGFSTPPGYYSMRCEEQGSWYIQRLCDVLDKYAATTDLVNMLTKTAQIVTMKSVRDADKTKHKQAPEFHSRLLRRIYFGPKQEEIVYQNVWPQQETDSPVKADSNQETSQQVTSQSDKFKHCNLM